MKNKKVIIVIAALLLVALCGFLVFGNNAEKPTEGGLQLGLTEEEKEESNEKEDSKKEDSEKKKESKDESKKEESQEKTEESSTSSETQLEENTIPEGGQAVDNGDGSVTIIINDDEDTIGF